MRLTAEHETILRVLKSFLSRQSSPLETGDSWDQAHWGEVLEVVTHHKLVPIFHHVLSREGLLEKVPFEERRALRDGYLESIAHTLFLESFLREMLVSFQSAGIPFIIIKGPSIAYEFYHPVGTRSYEDIDLLIRNVDYEKVKSVLTSLGMQVGEPGREEIRRKYFNSVVFLKPGEPKVMLDLHWETLMVSWNRRSFLGRKEVWDRIRWIAFSDLNLPVLQPDVLIPYLCLHLALHHQFRNLLALCDLGLMIQKYGRRMEWERLARQSHECRIRKPIYYALMLVSSLLEAEVPGEVLNQLRPNRIERGLLPFESLVFRKKRLPVHIERLVKFMLIDGLQGKINSLVAFSGQRRIPVSGVPGPGRSD